MKYQPAKHSSIDVISDLVDLLSQEGKDVKGRSGEAFAYIPNLI